MLGYIIIIAIVALFLLITYFPVLRQNRILHELDEKLAHELDLLSDLLRACLIIETRALGKGESQNSDITFAQAQINQPIATHAIMALMCDMSEE